MAGLTRINVIFHALLLVQVYSRRLEPELVEIPALGRHHTFGAMYDMRTNSFIGYNVFNEKHSQIIVPSGLRTENLNFTSSDVFAVDNLTDALIGLNIPKNLASSILSGQAQAVEENSSIINYLTRCYEWGECLQTQVLLVRQVNSSKQELGMYTESSEDYYNLTIFDNFILYNQATHVVSGITWGGNFIFSFESQRNLSPKSYAYRQNLSSTQNEIEDKTDTNENDCEWSMEDASKLVEKIKSLIQYDLTSALNIINKCKHVLTLRHFPDLNVTAGTIQSDSELTQAQTLGINASYAPDYEGVPIYYTLTPISSIVKYVTKNSVSYANVTPVNPASLDNIIEIFSWIAQIPQKASDLTTLIDANSVCIPDHEKPYLEELIKGFRKEVENFKTNLSSALYLARTEGNQSQLQDVIQAYRDEKNSQSVFHFYQKLDLAKSRLNYRIELYNNITKCPVVHTENATYFAVIIPSLHSPTDKVCALFLESSLKTLKATSWMEHVNLFYDLRDEKSVNGSISSSHSKRIVVDCDFVHVNKCEGTNQIVIRQFDTTFKDIDVSMLKAGSQIELKISDTRSTKVHFPCNSDGDANKYNNSNLLDNETRTTSDPGDTSLLSVSTPPDNAETNKITSQPGVTPRLNESMKEGLNSSAKRSSVTSQFAYTLLWSSLHFAILKLLRVLVAC